MPHKKDYSNLMTTEAFWAAWENHKGVIYYVVKRYANAYPLHNTPGNCDIEDTVGRVREEFHRLGVFARFNPSRTDSHMGHYVGAMTKATLQHLWQDHCRLNTRHAIRISTIESNYTDSEEQSKKNCSSNSEYKNLDLFLAQADSGVADWSALNHEVDNNAETEELLADIKNSISHASYTARNHSARRKARNAMRILKSIQEAVAEPTTRALDIAMNPSRISNADAAALCPQASATTLSRNLGISRVAAAESLKALRGITNDIIGG